MTGLLTERDKTEILELLTTLVGIPSVNTGEKQKGVPEQEVAEFISAYLQRLGMEIDWLRMENGRPNVLGHWPTSRQGKILVLTAHMDTVNVEGMTIDPFKAKVEGGKMFGRGTCDTKGSLAVYLWAMRHLADKLRSSGKDVRFLATCDEENGCIGSTWLAERGLVKADEVIVGEPTDSEIAVAHRGSIVLDIFTQGMSAHSSVPQRGDNAIYQMSEVIRQLRREWLAKVAEPSYPVLGNACASVTMVQGGVRFNVIPDSCRIVVDVRTLPNQTPEAIVQSVEAALAPIRESEGVKCRVDCQYYQPALYTEPECSFVQDLLQARREVTGQASPIGVAYFADSSQFARLGAKCVLLGPGNIAQAHNATEYVELEQVYQSAEVLLRFLNRRATE